MAQDLINTVSDSVGVNGKTIGISISESTDLQRLGFGEVHLQDAAIEFARYLLAGGAKLAYGGDLRKDGFTDILFQLVSQHNKSGLKPYERIESYLSWPIYLGLTSAQAAQYKQTANFNRVSPPTFLNIAATQTYIKPDTAEHRYIWAHCLTTMREEINAKVDARLLMGGKVQGYTGKYPGLLEEAYLALRDNKPLYLIGGFGGCAKAVVDALRRNKPETLSEASQLADPMYKQMVELYNADVVEKTSDKQKPIDYAEMVKFFEEKGIEGLNNGLDLDDNERLFTTIHIPEMIALVLKGLKNL